MISAHATFVVAPLPQHSLQPGGASAHGEPPLAIPSINLVLSPVKPVRELYVLMKSPTSADGLNERTTMV